LELSNVAKSFDANKTWKWIAFITAPPEILQKIKCVQYTLHPTFPDPVERVCSTSNTKYPFGLYATGWGTFNLRANVEFGDGSQKELQHVLDFSDAAAAQFEDH
jgi:transcription initiation factor IIF auxiliary subunit